MSAITHVVQPTEQHTHTIILLHGRGSNATEFASEFFESQDSDGCFLTDIFPGFKWVFPQARDIWAATEGEMMCQWFDLPSAQNSVEGMDAQKKALGESIASVLEVVEKESLEVGADHVFLGGISQGCATAICALLWSGKRSAGFVGMSSWLPHQEELESISWLGCTKSFRVAMIRRLFQNKLVSGMWTSPSFDAAFSTPGLITHNVDDEVVPLRKGKDLASTLRHLGMGVDFRCYEDGGHWVNEPRGVDHMVAFIKAHL
jgi:predicted esterase